MFLDSVTIVTKECKSRRQSLSVRSQGLDPRPISCRRPEWYFSRAAARHRSIRQRQNFRHRFCKKNSIPRVWNAVIDRANGQSPDARLMSTWIRFGCGWTEAVRDLRRTVTGCGLKVEPQSDFDLPRIAGAIGAAEKRGSPHPAETVELLVIQQILNIDDERHGRPALTG